MVYNQTNNIDFIKDLKPDKKQVNLHVIVLEVGKITSIKDHNLRTIIVADRTGSIEICVYDEPGNYIQQGDILLLSRCYASMFKGKLTVYFGKNGRITKTGEFCFVFNEQPQMSEPDIKHPSHPLYQPGLGSS